jgi:hypothetical protein
MFYPVRRSPMDALDVKTSIAESEQALQVLLQFARDQARKLEAHEAEKGIFKRLLPIGLAAMKLSCAQRGTGDAGPVVTPADGVLLPREQQLRGRDYFSLFGTFAVARTCYRIPGEPGIYPLDAQVNLPARCDSYVLQEWMTGFAIEHPSKRVRAGSSRSLTWRWPRARCGRWCRRPLQTMRDSMRSGPSPQQTLRESSWWSALTARGFP